MILSGYDIKLAEKLQAELSAARNPKGAGISAALVIGGRVVSSCAAGVCGDGVTPVSVDNLFNIGSISKVYCAAALRRLESLGKLRLDDPVYLYLPYFKTRDPRDRGITLRMLLNHSSGLPGTNSRNMIDPAKIALDRRASNHKYWSRAKLKAAPGEYSTYCNEGFELAAEVIEKVSGMEYMDFLKKEILLPLGLKSHRLAETLSGQEHPVFMIGQAEELICAKGAGAVSCTMEDNALFGYAFLKPGVLSAEEIADIGEATGKTFLKNDQMSVTYGLGWDGVEITEFGYDLGEHAVRKGGSTLQFTSYLVCIPKLDMSISLSATYDCGFYAGNEIFKLIKIAADHLGLDLQPMENPAAAANKAAEAGQLSPEALEERLAGYCGIYYGSCVMFRIGLEGSELVCETDSGGGWQEVYRLPVSLFDGSGFDLGGERIAFEEKDGTIYLLSSDFNMGVPLNPTAQKIPGFGEIPEGWKKRIGKKYITSDLTFRDLELDGPFTARAFEIGDGAVSFAVLGKNSGIISVRPCSEDDSEMFVNGPGYGSMNLWSPYFFREEGREILSIYDYDFICTDELPVFEGGEICAAPGKNAVYRLEKAVVLDDALPEGIYAAAVAEDGALKAVACPGDRGKAMSGAYLIFISDKEERRFKVCSRSI